MSFRLVTDGTCDLSHAVALERDIPVIFTEVNGSDATANAISRETGCQVAQLTMLMDGPEEGDLSTYLEGVRSNVNTIVSFFGGEELDQL